jgi:hypothetical protein
MVNQYIILKKEIMKEENGKAFIFDATFLHNAVNTSKINDRAILYIAFNINQIVV